MRIPVFVSCPSALSAQQEQSRQIILNLVAEQLLEARAVGRSDYPIRNPLHEVRTLARHCAGGLILGFTQFVTTSGTWKPGVRGGQRAQAGRLALPTPWNHLESGILFSLGLPLLVFREPGISGGIFDLGSSELFVIDMPLPGMSSAGREGLRQQFLRWSAEVRNHYYAGP